VGLVVEGVYPTGEGGRKPKHTIQTNWERKTKIKGEADEDPGGRSSS